LGSALFTEAKPRRMRWAGHVARMREKRNAHRTLVEKPEGKRPLGRSRRRWDLRDLLIDVVCVRVVL
jgi:hypothetical protein